MSADDTWGTVTINDDGSVNFTGIVLTDRKFNIRLKGVITSVVVFSYKNKEIPKYTVDYEKYLGFCRRNDEGHDTFRYGKNNNLLNFISYLFYIFSLGCDDYSIKRIGIYAMVMTTLKHIKFVNNKGEEVTNCAQALCEALKTILKTKPTGATGGSLVSDIF